MDFKITTIQHHMQTHHLTIFHQRFTLRYHLRVQTLVRHMVVVTLVSLVVVMGIIQAQKHLVI